MNTIRLTTLAKKESHRFLKVWMQTVFSPVMIALLYFVVFGAAFSGRVSNIEGISYLAFLVPGLALLQSTSNAFQNPSSSLIISKYHGTINDMLLAPLTPLERTLGYFFGGMLRGFLVSIIVVLVGFFFLPDFFPSSPFLLLSLLFLVNGIFSFLGTLIGLWGKTFDHIAGLTTFLIVPMGFLGGVFYSLDALPNFAQKISLFNPFLYFVDAARFSCFGTSDISPFLSFGITGVVFSLCFFFTYLAFKKEWWIKE